MLNGSAFNYEISLCVDDVVIRGSSNSSYLSNAIIIPTKDWNDFRRLISEYSPTESYKKKLKTDVERIKNLIDDLGE